MLPANNLSEPREGKEHHAAIGRCANPVCGFAKLPTAAATIKSFELMRIIRKPRCHVLDRGATGEVHFVNWQLRLAA